MNYLKFFELHYFLFSLIQNNTPRIKRAAPLEENRIRSSFIVRLFKAVVSKHRFIMR